MKVFVFGNEDITADSLPVRILPELRRRFPEIDFQLKDPNEDFELPEGTVIIDVVAGLKEIRVFDSLDDFQAPPHLTLHDFDLFSYLQFLKKLGKIQKMEPRGQAGSAGLLRQNPAGLPAGRNPALEDPLRPQEERSSGARIKIIGIPPTISEEEAIESISPYLLTGLKR